MPHPHAMPTEDSLETVWVSLWAKLKVTFSILRYHSAGVG